MSEPSQNVVGFITDSYQLISAASPTLPLQGNDLQKGIQFLNELLQAYAADGLMITVSQQVDFSLNIGQGTIVFAEPDYVAPPTPDVTVPGRLVNLLNAWVTLDNVTYPLIDESRTEFYSSYKYAPLMGLPRYIIIVPNINYTSVQVYPSPSQSYLLSVYGKFQLSTLTSSSTMSGLPSYYIRYLRLALARDLALYKGRVEAWTPLLDKMYEQAANDMASNSSTNLDININNESWLNGAWRVRAGI